MENEVSVWNKVMTTALSMPGVQVDRHDFITKELGSYCTKEQLDKAIATCPAASISKGRIDKLATACINNQTAMVTAISTAAGLPGGILIAATIPADMAQYYWHTFVLAQKLAYLYGFPDLRDENGNLTEASIDMLTLFVGVMMGAAAANQGIRYLSKAFAEQVVKRLPQKALTKTAYYPIIKQVAKWIGVKLTKDGFAKGVGKAIPILGGVISGGLTFATFRPSAKRLQMKLKEQMDDLNVEVHDYKGDHDFTFTEDENVYEESTEKDLDSPEKITIQFLINLTKIGGKMSPEKETFISNEIEKSILSEDEQLVLAQSINDPQKNNIDFSVLSNDVANSSILFEKGINLLKLNETVSWAEKLYLKKIVKDLAFSKE